MAGYTRQKTAEIAATQPARAADVAAEFNQVQSAFNASTGHRHNGTSGEGPPILVLGPNQQLEVDVSAVFPKFDDTLDVGKALARFKDGYFSGEVVADEFIGDLTGDVVGSADSLTTPRTINGTNFDGTANITTASWGTSRDITIAGNAKAVDGSADVSWTFAEIGGAVSIRATYGGTADAITLTTGVNISGTPPTGLEVRFRATSANTGATTIALDGGSPIACRTNRGAVLPAGYIRAASSGYSDAVAIYNGTNWIVLPSEPIAPGASADLLSLAADSVSTTSNTYSTQATSGTLNPGVWVLSVSYGVSGSTAGRARLIRSDTSAVLLEADAGLDNYSPAMSPLGLVVLDAPTTVQLQTSRRANSGTANLHGVRGTGYKLSSL